MFNEKLVKALEIEQEELLKKINDTREKGDYGTYKNLIKALTDVVMLIQREYDRIPKNEIQNLYFYCNRFDNKIEAIISFKNEIHRVVGDSNLISKYIKDLCKNNRVYIYGDTIGIGMAIADSLQDLELTTSPTKIVGTDYYKNSFTEKLMVYREYDKTLNNK